MSLPLCLTVLVWFSKTSAPIIVVSVKVSTKCSPSAEKSASKLSFDSSLSCSPSFLTTSVTLGSAFFLLGSIKSSSGFLAGFFSPSTTSSSSKSSLNWSRIFNFFSLNS
jgi:hypothetical protein